jgi:uncharacterized protein (TIGR00369 family)
VLAEAHCYKIGKNVAFVRAAAFEDSADNPIAHAELKGDELTLILPYSEHLVGNPLLPALHGGVVGALMELTAITQLAIASKSEKFAKTIDIGVDYLRSGKPVDTYARARVIKIGRRIANVQAEAWQKERSQPIAAMHGHFLVAE